jgi:hypothetical protein
MGKWGEIAATPPQGPDIFVCVEERSSAVLAPQREAAEPAIVGEGLRELCCSCAQPHRTLGKTLGLIGLAAALY